MNIYEKLISIRKSTGYIQKTEHGNQGAMYVDPAILMQKIRTKLDEASILLVPALSETNIDNIPDPTKNNPNATSFIFRSKMVYTFIDAESGEKLEVPWFIVGKHLQDPSMAGGAALTYFERYFLLKFFQIPTSKDDPEHFQAKTSTEITVDQANELNELITKSGTDLAAFLKYAQSDTVTNINPLKYGQLKSMLLAKSQKATS